MLIRRLQAKSSESISFKAIAGETISALKVVRGSSLIPDEVFLASSNSTFNDAIAYGVSITAGNAGDEIEVITGGRIVDSFFSSFTVNDLVFLGVNGSLTQTPPTSGHRVVVGRYVGHNVVVIEISDPIIL